MENPYLAYFMALPAACRRDRFSPVDARELASPAWLQFKAAVAGHYAWAVPTGPAVDAIARHATRVLEVGCGSGYWAWLLAQRGIDVLATDPAPPPHRWHDVVIRGADEAGRHPDRALLLCWPPFGIDMAHRALAAYRGDMVVYVGEWLAGSAEPAFFALLASSFEPVEFVDLPQWAQRTDFLLVLRRRSARTAP
jgi:SAM-dependent methyltransferase